MMNLQKGGLGTAKKVLHPVLNSSQTQAELLSLDYWCPHPSHLVIHQSLKSTFYITKGAVNTFCGVIDKMWTCLGYPSALYSSFQPTCWLYVPHTAKIVRGSCQEGWTYTAVSDARSCGSWTPPHLESWHHSVQNCRYRCCLCDCAPFPGVHRGQEIAAFSRNTGSTGNRPYSRCSVPAPEIKLTMPKFRWYGMKLKKQLKSLLCTHLRSNLPA